MSLPTSVEGRMFKALKIYAFHFLDGTCHQLRLTAQAQQCKVLMSAFGQAHHDQPGDRAALRGAAIPPAEETAQAECRVAMYINIVETLHCSCSARRMDSALSEELGLDMLEVTHAVSAFQVTTDHLEANTSPKARLEEGFGIAGLGRPAGTLRRNTYNFCNAPHVNAAHYELPPNITATGGQLVHVSVVMCHHKCTLNNLAPSERTLNPPMGRTRIDVVQHVRSRRRSDCA
ncbi:hypothetical protein BC826DRAFT_1106613 [Russula brevipes]|nr:hypothetical protein BC826DRAFT_1106613 [Russula brevipes]